MNVLRSILSDPGRAYYYGQKVIRVAWLRKSLGALCSALAPQAGKADTPLVRRILGDLAETGFAPLPENTLSAQQLADIHGYFAGLPVNDYHDAARSFPSATQVSPDCKRAAYDMRDTLACTPLMTLANDPGLLDAVGQYLGCKPTLASVEAWWTFGENNPDGAASADDIFHRDVDDLRFVKLFIYLTDVQEDNGAHCFVLKSHRDARLTRRGAIADDEVERLFDAADRMVVTGKAGTAFLENTWGIHRPLMARRGRRLIFSAIYTVRGRVPWAQCSPLAVPAGLDSYVNRHLYRKETA